MTPSNTELREAVDRIVVSMIRTFSPDDSLVPLAEGENYTAYDRDGAVIAILALFQAREQQLLTELLGGCQRRNPPLQAVTTTNPTNWQKKPETIR